MPLIRRWQSGYEIKSKEKHHNFELVASMKKACEEEIVSSIHTNRDVREIKNIVNVYSMAIQEMQKLISDGPTFEPTEINSDWASVFYDCAKDCSREELQILWSKILIQECKGEHYYKRTLWTLRNLETEEAKCLVELAPFLINKSFLPVFVYHQGIMPFNKILALHDCGCINSKECYISYSNDEDIKLTGYFIKQLNLTQDISFYGMTLTDVGVQLINLIQDVVPNEKFIEGIRYHLENEYKDKAELVAFP